ncbi:hypothetical protein SELMODRAFT_429713 [Selaginella moellendorffii]|uniref:Uncharacterized protein n=1 Tax=Selaginella moellendorffii TaxID=88036 RepID=D8T724_SELML|nr:hypothetical protein SELMODRAFT_429713 [Selaginella moellendorffii]
MNLEGVKPEAITVVSVLDFCSIPDGKMVHASILGTGLEKQIRVQNALITMYSEGGCLQRARDVFNTINNPNGLELELELELDVSVWDDPKREMVLEMQPGSGTEVRHTMEVLHLWQMLLMLQPRH